MTKKDYIKIATVFSMCKSTLSNGQPIDGAEMRQRIISTMANVLELDNPLFDTSKFLTACEIE